MKTALYIVGGYVAVGAALYVLYPVLPGRPVAQQIFGWPIGIFGSPISY